MERRGFTASVFAAIWFSFAATLAHADDKPAQDKPDMMAVGKNLIASLKSSPGCLGVETAQTSSGKQVIFAWFENKKAASTWYYSDAHRNLMRTFFPGQKYDKPMQEVPDDGKPIMAIASLTLSDKSKFKETKLPISQISIELYRPLSGGVFLGGRFAPEAMKVPNMKDYTPKETKK